MEHPVSAAAGPVGSRGGAAPAEARPLGEPRTDSEDEGFVGPLTQRVVAAAVVVCLHAASAPAQPADILASARTAATSGHRPQALADLERHLRESPRDVDARLLYGLVLSWEGRYDDARRELGDVLVQTPGYNDARMALANIAWWNGDYTELARLAATGRMQRPDDVEWLLQEARALDGLERPREARRVLQELLSRSPGHPQARSMKNRLDASLRPWSLTMSYGVDRFSDDRTPWDEYTVSINRQTPVGSVIVPGQPRRALRACPTGCSKWRCIPASGPAPTASSASGSRQDDVLYPNYRVATDLYQSLGGGFEASAGFRRLGLHAPPPTSTWAR